MNFFCHIKKKMTFLNREFIDIYYEFNPLLAFQVTATKNVAFKLKHNMEMDADNAQ